MMVDGSGKGKVAGGGVKAAGGGHGKALIWSEGQLMVGELIVEG